MTKYRMQGGRWRRVTMGLSLAALCASVIVTPAVGAPEVPQLEGFERLDLDGIDVSGFTPAYLDEDRTVHVMVELDGDPVALERAAARASGRELTPAQASRIAKGLEKQQDRLAGQLRGLGAKVERKLQHAYNGVRIRVPASELEAIAGLPGVKAVRAIERHEISNATSAAHLGVPEQVWTDLGVTGEGVSIAIIDTGIDYTHANFGGAGTPEAFEANDPTVVEPGSFPTAKVVGGYDFVGDAYDASSDDPAAYTPNPDDDPIDCNAHGTHVAGSAAGFGVDDGAAYAGPYAGLDPTSLDIGPGMAPNATLYALKVFGCEGSTDVTVDAIDWAVANGVDVINMSLGSSFGRATDPSAVAATNAVMAGVVVVASAGNSDDIRYITGSPASSDGAISVAATDVAFAEIPQAVMAAVAMQNSNGAPIPGGEITANVHVLTDDPTTPDVDESLGCLLSDYDEVSAGDIVITFRATCARVDRAKHGQTVGASAVVMVNNSAGLPPFEGQIPGVTIPFLGARSSAGAALAALHGTTQTLAEAPAVANPSYGNFAGFTSGGPRNGDAGAKPDISAPGVAVDSSLVGTGSGSARFSGTSMAAPIVAGIAALTVETHDGWTAEQVKAAIVNSGTPAGVGDYRTTRGGSGLVTPLRAVEADIVALGDDLTASLGFGLLSGTDEDTYVKAVTLEGADADLDVSVEWSETAPGVTLDVPASAAVADGGFDVELTVDWSAVGGYATVSGTLLLSDADHELRVPFVAVLDPASAITTEIVAMPRQDGTATFQTSNASTVGGTIDVYAWMLEDAEGDTFGTFDPAIPSPVDIRAVGVQSFPDALAPGESLAVAAVNSHHRTATAIVNEYDVLWDVDEDGSPDYVTVGVDFGLVLGLGFIDVPVSVTFDVATGAMVDAWLAGVDYDSSTILLPVTPELIGLGAAGDRSARLLGVATYSLEGYGDDWASARRADVDFFGGSPAVEVGQYATVPGGASFQWSATVNRTQRSAGILGWMAVTSGDTAGSAEAELLRLDVRGPAPRKGGKSG